MVEIMDTAWRLPTAQALGLTNSAKLVPQPGAEIFDWLIGANCTVPVEYEVEPGERGSMNPDSPHFGPSTPDQVRVLGLFVNGQWIDAEDLLGAKGTADLIETITEARGL